MSDETYRRAFERWLKYEQEAQLANTHHLAMTIPSEPGHNFPNVVMPREVLTNMRANFTLLRNVVAELLDLDPDKMTQQDIIMGMIDRTYAKTKP